MFDIGWSLSTCKWVTVCWITKAVYFSQNIFNNEIMKAAETFWGLFMIGEFSETETSFMQLVDYFAEKFYVSFKNFMKS